MCGCVIRRIYLCNRSCPPCSGTDQSLPASRSPPKTPARYGLRCPCKDHRRPMWELEHWLIFFSRAKTKTGEKPHWHVFSKSPFQVKRAGAEHKSHQPLHPYCIMLKKNPEQTLCMASSPQGCVTIAAVGQVHPCCFDTWIDRGI